MGGVECVWVRNIFRQICAGTLLPRIQVHALIYVAEAKVHALK